MLITLDLMSAFVRCRYQAYLKCTGEVGEASGYASLQRKLASDYEQKACAKLAEPLDPSDVLSDPPSIADALTRHHRLILNAPSVDDRRSVVFPAIERPILNKGKPEFAPIAFSPNKKLSKDEKHTAALAGTALSCWHALDVKYVRVIHGPEFLSTKLVLLGNSGPTHLAKESLAALHDLEALAANPTPPPMYLNDHCGVCEYRDRCRKDAVARDDLSLLRGLQPKEIEAWKKRGIFTVTQLSYTFRAKTMGRSSQQPKRHSQPLQAMAIRDKKTYIRKRPEMPTEATRVYFDVEGVPEREFFYLIGAVVVKDGAPICVTSSGPTTSHQEETMWQSSWTCWQDLATIG